jgi:hypothetical protein
MRGTFDKEWETTLFRQTINKTVKVDDTAIRGVFRDGSMARADSENECQERCNNDAYCSAFSYCVCPDKRHNCELFASNSIGLLFKETGTTSYIILERLKR